MLEEVREDVRLVVLSRTFDRRVLDLARVLTQPCDDREVPCFRVVRHVLYKEPVGADWRQPHKEPVENARVGVGSLERDPHQVRLACLPRPLVLWVVAAFQLFEALQHVDAVEQHCASHALSEVELRVPGVLWVFAESEERAQHRCVVRCYCEVWQKALPGEGTDKVVRRVWDCRLGLAELGVESCVLEKRSDGERVARHEGSDRVLQLGLCEHVGGGGVRSVCTDVGVHGRSRGGRRHPLSRRNGKTLRRDERLGE